MAEKTKAELQEELDRANAEILSLKEQFTKEANQSELELTELKKHYEASQAGNKSLQSDLEEALELIAQQNEALTKDDTHTESVVVTVDKKKYRVTAPVINVGGKEVTAAELKENKELAAKLVAKGSGILQLLG